MKYRKFGRTGLDVGVISLGTEYLFKKACSFNVKIIDKMRKYVELFDTHAEVNQ